MLLVQDTGENSSRQYLIRFLLIIYDKQLDMLEPLGTSGFVIGTFKGRNISAGKLLAMFGTLFGKANAHHPLLVNANLSIASLTRSLRLLHEKSELPTEKRLFIPFSLSLEDNAHSDLLIGARRRANCCRRDT